MLGKRFRPRAGHCRWLGSALQDEMTIIRDWEIIDLVMDAVTLKDGKVSMKTGVMDEIVVDCC